MWGHPLHRLTALRLFFDTNNNVYVADSNGSIDFVNRCYGRTTAPFLKLNFTPAGMAVDSNRGRIYLSDPGVNFVAVYSTTNGDFQFPIKVACYCGCLPAPPSTRFGGQSAG